MEAPATGPTEALEALLERVQSDDDYRGSGFRSGEQVTENFVAAVDELAGDGEPLPFDPFLCTQQLPRRIDYVGEQVDGETARVTAVQSYAPGVDETQTYDLVLEDGAWKLDRSECAG